MEPHELILSEVHMESCPPGQHAWVTEFFYTEGYQPRHEQPRTGCAAVEQACTSPGLLAHFFVHHTLRQVLIVSVHRLSARTVTVTSCCRADAPAARRSPSTTT